MMMGLFDAFPPQDIFYGLARGNFAPRLTDDNWRVKGIIRIFKDVDGGSWLYCWIRERTQNGSVVYQARLHPMIPVSDEDLLFHQLADVMSFLNGEDGGWMQQYTRLAQRSEWPEDEATPTMVRGIGTKVQS